jgi:hypothetical protein
MAVRWSPLKVKQAADSVEEIIKPIMEPLEKARQVVAQAQKLPHLSQSIQGRLGRLQAEINEILGYQPSWSTDATLHQKGSIHKAIDAIRSDLPKDDLAKEEHRYKLYLEMFGSAERADIMLGVGTEETQQAPLELVTEDGK